MPKPKFKPTVSMRRDMNDDLPNLPSMVESNSGMQEMLFNLPDAGAPSNGSWTPQANSEKASRLAIDLPIRTIASKKHQRLDDDETAPITPKGGEVAKSADNTSATLPIAQAFQMTQATNLNQVNSLLTSSFTSLGGLFQGQDPLENAPEGADYDDSNEGDKDEDTEKDAVGIVGYGIPSHHAEEGRGVTTKDEWTVNLLEKRNGVTIHKYPEKFSEDEITAIYDHVVVVDFNAQKSIHENVALIILCAGFDHFFSVNASKAQVRLLIFIIVMRHEMLGRCSGKLEMLYLKAWFEHYYINHQFYCRRRFVRAWINDKETYLPRLCSKAFQVQFRKVQRKLNIDLQLGTKGDPVLLSKAATGFTKFFGYDFRTQSDSVVHEYPPEIRRAFRVPSCPRPTAECPRPKNMDCVITSVDMEEICGDEAYKKYVTIGAGEILGNIEAMMDQLAISSQEPLRLSPGLCFDEVAAKNYCPRGPGGTLNPTIRIRRAQSSLRGTGNDHRCVDVPEAHKHEDTLNAARALLDRLERCRRIMAASKENKRDAYLLTTIDYMRALRKAIQGDVKSGKWLLIQRTSVGADLASCMKESHRFIEESTEFLDTSHPIGDHLPDFSDTMKTWSKGAAGC